MSLPRESAPPPHVANAIAAELRRSRLLRRRRAPGAIAAVMAVAVAALVTFGPRESPPRANYVLFLYETPQFSGGSREEYAAWARQMRPLVVGGEELTGSVVFGGPSSLAGYFYIDAPDEATAARVARACPHLRHGGGVELRKIVTAD